MTALLYVPVVLSVLVLGAHLLRRLASWPLLGPHSFAAALVLAGGACIAIFALLAVRRRWAARTVQALLLLGMVEWVRTLVVFSRERIAAGEPYLRLVVIIGSVALFTALSSLIFFTRRFRAIYRAPAGE
jgi:uncharacterized membrane protein